MDFVEEHITEWGIDVENVMMRDIILNQEL
jgi:hypothetical protein